MKTVSVIGLGKLGSCMAAVYASKGFNTIGVDINKNVVKAINNKKAPVNEAQLDKFIKKGSRNLQATNNTEKAVLNSDITFIIVPTPIDKTGGFSVKHVINVCKEIGKALQKKKKYHLIVLTSTVLPGDSEQKIIPVLEKYSEKKCGKGFGFCYSPEFIAIGTIIHDLLNPDFILIGEFDKKSGQILKKLYSYICNNNPAVEIMNIPTAELTKISLNSFVTAKITFANILGEICENIPKADVDRVTKALGNDKRIGRYFLKSGLGFGGPCFPRDNLAFVYMAKKYGAKSPIAKAVHSYNQKMANRVGNIFLKNISQNKKIGFLGLSYKPGTPVVEESHSLKIVKKLIKLKYKIFVYEPAGYQHARSELKNKVIYCKNLKECLEKCDVFFISNVEKEFFKIKNFIKNKKNKVIFDPWRMFKNIKFNKNIKYVTLGLGK